MKLLTERYAEKIAGVLACFDRVVIQGTLPTFCHAQGMAAFLSYNKIRIFDYPHFAEPLRDALRDNAQRVASENGLEIEFIRKNNFRKEKRIQEILEARGNQPGLVHIFSAMEPCHTYKAWHDKQTHKTFLKPDNGKCLHYYFYFIDEGFGLGYVRVPTWCPFRLQIYFNGHNWLQLRLINSGIPHRLLDNAFCEISDFSQAQSLSDAFKVERLHTRLDLFAQRFCPIIKQFDLRYHWSIMQAEYATDIVFKHPQDLHCIYGHLTRTAIHAVKPHNIATFLGRKLHDKYEGEMGNAFNTRIEGIRIKHTMGPVSIKMYDKFGQILRIETTVNDVSFFKHYRMVEHRDGSQSRKLAQMKKAICSLPALSQLLVAANRRYLEFISAIDDPTAGIKKLDKISRTVNRKDRFYRGFNLFDDDDQLLFESIASGEFTITGFQNKHLRRKLRGKTSAQISRIIKRLHVHGLIKKIAHTYKYYLTNFGTQVVTMGLKLKELVIIPHLAEHLPLA